MLRIAIIAWHGSPTGTRLGTAAGVDKAWNMTADPIKGAAYAWDVRNDLVTATGSGADPIRYERVARRNNLPGAIS